MSRNDGGRPRFAESCGISANESPSVDMKLINSGKGIFMLDGGEKWLLDGGLAQR